GGSTFGIDSDCLDCVVDQPNIVDQLESHGMSWKAYFEDLPSPCFKGTQSGGYVLQHNPFLYFADIRTDTARCDRIVPLTEFESDLKSGAVADFVWIGPSIVHSMHSGSIAEGDRWLSSIVPGILASPPWRENGLLLITWDEGQTNAGCCALANGGR